MGRLRRCNDVHALEDRLVHYLSDCVRGLFVVTHERLFWSTRWSRHGVDGSLQRLAVGMREP